VHLKFWAHTKPALFIETQCSSADRSGYMIANCVRAALFIGFRFLFVFCYSAKVSHIFAHARLDDVA